MAALTATITADVGGLIANMEIAKAKLRDLQAEMRKTATEAVRSGGQLDDATKSSLANLGQQAQATKREIANTGKEIARQFADAARGVHANSGAIREVIVELHELITGRFSRMGGSALVLAERMGNLHGIVQALVSPIGLATGAALALAGALGVVAFKALEARNALAQAANEAAIFGGMSGAGAVAKVNEYADQLQRSGVLGRSAAVEIASGLVKVNNVADTTRDKFASLAEAFTQYGAGGDSKKAIEDLTKILDQPVEFAQKNAQIFTEAEQRQIATMTDSEGRLKAQGIVYDALSRKLKGYADAIKEAQAAQAMQIPGAGMMAEAGTSMASMPTSAFLPLHLDIPAGRSAEATAQVADQMKLQMRTLQLGLDQQLAATKGNRSAMLQVEISYWNNVLRTQQLSAENRLEIEDKIAKAQEQLNVRGAAAGERAAKKSYEDFSAQEQAKLAEAHGNAAEIEAIFREWEAEAERLYGRNSAQWQRIERERVNAARQAAAEILREEERTASAQERTDRLYRGAFERNMKQMVATRQISLVQAYGFDQQYAAQLYASERAQLQSMLNNDNLTKEQHQDLTNRLLELDAEYAEKTAQYQEEAAQAAANSWRGAARQIGSAFADALTDILDRSKTTVQALANLFGSILRDTLRSTFQGIFNSILGGSGGGGGLDFSKLLFGAGGLGSLLFGAAGLSGALGLGSGGLLGALGIGGGAAAGAGLFGWLGGLFGGGGGLSAGLDALGIAAAPLGFSRGGVVPSAAGGWQVPSFASGGIPSILHANEMVLPAHISQGFQDMFANGGGAGLAVHFNVSAIDGTSVAKFFHAHGPTIVSALNGAIRRGSSFQPA